MPKKLGKKNDFFDAAVAFSGLSSGVVRKKKTTSQRRMLASGVADVEQLNVMQSISVELYLRVSSSRSVESNLSIPEQESRLTQFCKDQGWRIGAIFLEAGKSAKTADRPQFKLMLQEAISDARPFQKILIWSTSRFSRSSTDYAIAERLLTQYGIEVLTISQTFSNDATGWVAKGVATPFDQYHSDRSAEESINARVRMVKEGNWPGGTPPDGYRLIDAPQNPRRKVCIIDEERRPIIERIYSLSVHGDGNGPPLGIKAIAKWLNSKGYRTRTGSRWSIQAIHRVLTNSAYYGDYYWGLEGSVRQRGVISGEVPGRHDQAAFGVI
jgi:site-specific DNA recombinase